MRSPLNAKIALVCGMLASIGASACCVGPLLLLSLGIGGAWIGNLAALERYRPVFIALVLAPDDVLVELLENRSLQAPLVFRSVHFDVPAKRAFFT